MMMGFAGMRRQIEAFVEHRAHFAQDVHGDRKTLLADAGQDALVKGTHGGFGLLQHRVSGSGEHHELGASVMGIGLQSHKTLSNQQVSHALHSLAGQAHVAGDMGYGQRGR